MPAEKYLWAMHCTKLSTPCILQYCIIFFFILLLYSPSAHAQRPTYKIIAELDTVSQVLKGIVEITYTNNSTIPLDSIGIHLWANAHQTRNTALVNQKLHLGDMKLYRAPEVELGGFEALQFTSDEQSIRLTLDNKHIDIAWLVLSKALQPGTSITFSSPYKLKIPKSFSRLGRTGRSYQMTQWYPHVAVFENNVWHMMPNLDQSEYYNDFADYDVVITVPVNYKIAAPGVLESQSTNSVFVMNRYTATNVIDFAWYASPDFIHDSRLVDVGGEKPVELHVYYEHYLNDFYTNALMYGERALKFYSDWLGPYPYPTMTIVHAPFGAAGFMEYPMLAQLAHTNDPEFFDRVIAHEIGHTWLYAVLANNERKYPWMDEGLNSFLENEYMAFYYENSRDAYFPSVLHGKGSMPDNEALIHMVREAGDLQPPMTDPVWQNNSPYLLSAYELPSQGLRLLKTQVGLATMKAMFRNYFHKNKFKHVSPSDLHSAFDEVTDKDISWFFDQWLFSAHQLDYRITKPELNIDRITIANFSNSSIPLFFTEYHNDLVIDSHWVEGFTGEKSFTLNEQTDEIRLYDGFMGINRKWWRNTYPRTILPRITVFPKIGMYDRPSLSVTPVIGYNLTDGGLPGLAVTTNLFPQPRWKLFLMPLYGLESKKFRYFGEGRFHAPLASKPFDKLLIGLSASQFGYHLDTHYLFRDHFTKWMPFLGIRFRAADHSHSTSWIKYRYVDIRQHYGMPIDFENYVFENKVRRYGVHEFSYSLENDTVMMPYRMNAALQTGKGFVRLNVHYNQHFRGKDKLRGTWIHGFAGWLPYHQDAIAYVPLTINGITSNDFLSKDYMYDEWLLGRNAENGNLSHQIFMKDAGLKTLANTGIGKEWMLGAGFSTSLPFKIFHAYMDGALYENALTDKITLSYSGGLAVILIKDAFEIYIPILESKDIKESLLYDTRDSILERISFLASFKLANPLALIDNGQFQFN